MSTLEVMIMLSNKLPFGYIRSENGLPEVDDEKGI